MRNLQGTSVTNIVIGITLPDGKHRARHWQGRSKASILAAARLAYPGAKLNTGTIWYTNSYGAH